MNEQLALIEKKEGVATVTLNRPEKRNALSVALRNTLVECFDGLAADEEVEVTVLTGTPPAFCAGFDLGELMSATDEEREKIFRESEHFHKVIYAFPKPVICAVNGPAMAGGFDLALLCDIRWAADTAYFQHREITLGLVALYSILREMAGAGVARDLCLTGRRITAQEALELGVVTRVLSPGDLLPEVQEMATAMAQYPNKILRQEKAHILSLTDLDVFAGT